MSGYLVCRLLLENKTCARSEEHTSELQSRVDISYAVFCLKKTCRIMTAAPPRAAQTPLALDSWHPGCRGDRRGTGPPRRPADPAWSSARLASSFFNATATTEIYTLSLHDALPI